MHYFYFHGFMSSPKAAKAEIMRNVLGSENVSAPDFNLPSSRRVSILLSSLIKKIKPFADSTLIIGSSLGGLYALYVSSFSGCKCILLNPCLFPQLVIGSVSFQINVKNIAFAQRLSLKAYENYNWLNVRLWVTDTDEIIDHEKLTKPFFYNPPSEYKIFSSEEAYGHKFSGFESVLKKYLKF